MSSAPPTPMPADLAAMSPVVSTAFDFEANAIACEFPIRRFSVDEYFRMVDAEILTDEDKVELLEGIIVVKMTKNPPHDGMIDLLMALLWRSLPLGWYPRCQHAFITTDSVPEPDIAVIRGQPQEYMKRHPR